MMTCQIIMLSEKYDVIWVAFIGHKHIFMFSFLTYIIDKSTERSDKLTKGSD